MDDLENTATFLSVASTLSFVKTAHAMNLRQPSVTARIKRLEERLGVTLFIRNKNHRIHLTQEGREFLPYARQMIQLMQEAENKVRSIKKKAEGKIRIGATPTWSVNVLPKILGTVRSGNPEVEFHVVHGNTKAIRDMVLGNEIDVGLIASDVSHQQIQQDCAHVTPWVLVCSPQHRLAECEEIEIQEILREPLVTYEQSTDGWRGIQRIFSSYHAIPNVVAELNQLEAAKVMVIESSFVSLLPFIGVQRELKEGSLVAVRVRQLSEIQTVMSIIYLKSKASYLLIEVMRKDVSEYFDEWHPYSIRTL
ncbi:LysR family transcriptional regulator [Alicyclobacillus fastidiosus]|uniref:LysR family transcriptional regulator n=1 Tax=Alicyclobacillus fastidiosus TaxID=392011 RepID=A0ABY6ZBI1_9BACL|nr:LysR family transcriptional regulator [Alicyclobacillus fastidiosus]WAH40253.1 LysR family transcriptional regulator [Alicyclobacillus fastidiosus]